MWGGGPCGLAGHGTDRTDLRRRASLHLGIYAAPDRSLVFDLDDFDETLPGPWDGKGSVDTEDVRVP